MPTASVKFKFEEARAGYAKGRDGAERSYLALMADLKEHAATFGGPQPETAQAEEQRLRNKFPALNGASGLGAASTEFRARPAAEHLASCFAPEPPTGE